MYTLIIDTSTERGLVALAQGLDVLLIKYLPFGNESSRTLFTTIESLFEELKIDPSSLKAVACGSGPGSFTGMRVGVASAKGIAYPLNIPLIGFCSLSGFVSEKRGVFCSLIDAKVGGAYLLLQKREAEIEELSKPLLCPLNELEEKVKGVIEIVGPNLSKFEFEKKIEVPPCATHLAKIVENRFAQKLFSKDGTLPLYYLREGLYSR